MEREIRLPDVALPPNAPPDLTLYARAHLLLADPEHEHAPGHFGDGDHAPILIEDPPAGAELTSPRGPAPDPEATGGVELDAVGGEGAVGNGKRSSQRRVPGRCASASRDHGMHVEGESSEEPKTM